VEAGVATVEGRCNDLSVKSIRGVAGAGQIGLLALANKTNPK
jgi:hypothetical protein